MLTEHLKLEGLLIIEPFSVDFVRHPALFFMFERFDCSEG